MEFNKLVGLRKQLHTIAELSGKEKKTKKLLLEFIKEYNPDDIIENLGGYGFALIYSPKEERRKSVLFRADMDALPIEESNTFEHTSRNNGVSHMCGHDGHMASLASLCESLNNKRPQHTEIVLLFQPAEETGEGAKAVIESQNFNKLNPDYVFGAHNLPGYEFGKMVYKHGTFSAASTGIIIKLTGKTSHAAEPENGISPVPAVAELLELLYNFTPDIKTKDYFLNTVVYSRVGDVAFGTSPGYAEVMSTLRAYNQEDFIALKQFVADTAVSTALQYGLECEIEFREEFPANYNSDEAVNLSLQAAEVSGIGTIIKEKPFGWSEDFGYFSQMYKSSFVGFGAGISFPDLHNPNYDFPDELIKTINSYFINLIKIIDEKH